MKVISKLRRGELPLSFVAVFILVLASIIITFILITQFKDSSNSATEDSECISSVKAHSTAIRLSKELSGADLPIICPSHDIVVKTTNPEVVKAAVANEMKSCWYRWGEGKLQLFKDDGTYCHVCSMIQVDGVDNIQGFSEYLDTKKANSKQTYSEYLSGAKYGTYYNQTEFQKSASSSMQTKNIGVVFVYAKGKNSIDTLINTIATPAKGAAIGMGVGMIIGLGVCYGVGAIVTVGTGGVGTPVLLACAAAGAAAGGAAGMYKGYEAHKESSYMSIVLVRPLDANELNALGCQYTKAQNK